MNVPVETLWHPARTFEELSRLIDVVNGDTERRIRSVIPVADVVGVAMYETFQEDGRAAEDERRGVAETCGAVA